MSREFANLVVEEFGAKIGLPGLTLDTEGQIALHIGPITVSIFHESTPIDALWLSAELGELHDDVDAPAFLLQLNHVTWAGQAMTITLNDEDRIIAFVAIPTLMLTMSNFDDVFASFGPAALAIAEQIAARNYADLDDAATGATSAPVVLPPFTGMRV